MLDPLAVEGIEPRTLGWFAGLILLLFGRRLYWLFSGIIGFLAGLYLAYLLLPSGPEWLALLGGLLVGACGALLAVFFQKIALGVAGFLAGGYAVFWLSGEMGWAMGALQWLAALAAGIFGALLVRVLFEIGLILASSLLGATLLVQASGWHGGQASVLFLLLLAIGVVAQAVFARRREKKKR